MALKKIIKNTEARILVLLETMSRENRYAYKIAPVLSVDYYYIIRTIKQMVRKGWVAEHPYDRKVYYANTDAAPLEDAKKILAGIGQKKLGV